MKGFSLVLACSLLRASSAGTAAPPAPTIATDHGDTTRQSWNAREYTLTPANVASNFGKLGTLTVDSMVYAQPLFVPGVVVAGSQHDLLIVATTNNSVYAFDANTIGDPLWQVSLGSPSSTTCADLYGNLGAKQVGIMSTPVVDVSSGLLFVVASSNTPRWIVYKIALATGATVSSEAISGSVPGTGSGSSGGTLTFNPADQDQRAGLTLANGNIYIGFGGFCDVSPWHGWIFSYSESSLSQAAIFCTTPNGNGAGIWNSNGGLIVDSSGALYTFTGNGDWDGSVNWGESILKLSSSLTVTDWFTPSNWAALNGSDLDVSSGRAMLLPGGLISGSGKDARVLVVDTADLGHLQGSGSGPKQIFSFGSKRLYGGLYFNGTLYFADWASNSGPTYAFVWNGSTFATSGATTQASFGFPGAQLTASSSGVANGIIWQTTTGAGSDHPGSIPAGTLRAFDPVTLAEIYNSDSAGGDSLGLLSKMAPPTVANGRVFVATQSDYIAVYGIK